MISSFLLKEDFSVYSSQKKKEKNKKFRIAK